MSRIKYFLAVIIFFTFAISCSEQDDQSSRTFETDQGLSLNHKNEFRKDLIEVTDDIFVGVGYGLANSIMIETSKSLIIVDTLGSEERASELFADFRKITDKPVNVIVYTHNHLDHLGGATIFAEDSNPDIYAQENIIYNLDNIATTIRPIIFERSARQFGIPLPSDEIVHQGIGGFLEINDQSTLGLVRPNKLFKDEIEINVDGLIIKLVHVPGETDDHLYVWIPEKEVVLVGDNFYRSFANLYAIRGTKFRNPMEWVESLDKIIELDAKYLIPSHTRPIQGKDNIKNALTDYRDGIQFIHDQTIRYINKGLTPDEIVAKVKLPNHLAESPYLQPFYGSISSYVRSIFSGYIGWFSGNVTDLHPLSPQQRAIKISEIALKQTSIEVEAVNALNNGEFQWAMELSDLLLAVDSNNNKAKEIKSDAAEKLSMQQLASNDYYFYKTIAGELKDTFDVSATNNKVTPDQLRATPLKSIMRSLPVNLNAEKSLEINKTVMFEFNDLDQIFTIHVRKGVAQLINKQIINPDIVVKTNQQELKEIFAGLKNVASISLAMTNGSIDVKGGKVKFLQFLGLFTD